MIKTVQTKYVGHSFALQLSGKNSFSLFGALGTKLQAILISRRLVTRHRIADVTTKLLVFWYIACANSIQIQVVVPMQKSYQCQQQA